MSNWLVKSLTLDVLHMIIYFEFVDELTKLIFSVWLAVCDRKWYHNPTKADIFFCAISKFAGWSSLSPTLFSFLTLFLFYHVTSSIYLCSSELHPTTWWRHQMETFSALLALCAGNSPVTGEIPTQRPVTRSFDAFFYLRLNIQFSIESWGWWFETPLCLLWRHCNRKCHHIC